MATPTTLPLKNVTTALLLSIFFGPIGLLYATFWGGFMMSFISLVVFTAHRFFPIILLWMISCIWAVGAAELHNRRTTAHE